MILEDASIQPQHCSLFVTLNAAQKTTQLSAIFWFWGHERQHWGLLTLREIDTSVNDVVYIRT